MTIFVVSEENHGEIIYAATEEAAKRALLETDWVGRHSDIWIENEKEKCGGHHESLSSLYGENWGEEFMKMDSDALERMGFYISEYEVCE